MRPWHFAGPQFSPKMWTKHLDGATLGDSVRSRGNVVSPALRARRWTWHSNPQRWEWWLGNIWKHWESWPSCVSKIRFAVSVAERRCFPAWSTIRTIWRWRQSNGRSWDMVPGCTMPRLKRLDHFKESCDKAFVWTCLDIKYWNVYFIVHSLDIDLLSSVQESLNRITFQLAQQTYMSRSLSRSYVPAIGRLCPTRGSHVRRPLKRWLKNVKAVTSHQYESLDMVRQMAQTPDSHVKDNVTHSIVGCP